jgi:hypothetical protein
VTAFSSRSITVGDLTCSITPSFSKLIGNAVAVGDKASIACVDGLLSALAVGKTS